jgi:hypothetical protein
MKALCWHGMGDVRVDTVPDPKIARQTMLQQVNPTGITIRTSIGPVTDEVKGAAQLESGMRPSLSDPTEAKAARNLPPRASCRSLSLPLWKREHL